MRMATGNQIFYRDDSLLKIVRELKNNHSVAVMMDITPTNRQKIDDW